MIKNQYKLSSDSSAKVNLITVPMPSLYIVMSGVLKIEGSMSKLRFGDQFGFAKLLKLQSGAPENIGNVIVESEMCELLEI